MRRSPSDRDRKSTRLNSSHQIISYAVFCLNHLYTTQSHTLSLHDALPISLAGKVDGRVVDTSHRIDQDASVAIVTERDPEGLDVIRHSTAHLLAYAVKELFPDAQVTIGPVIENGFYYDFSYKRPFTPDDLAAIEKRMAELAKRDLPVTREVWPRDKAVEFFN